VVLSEQPLPSPAEVEWVLAEESALVENRAHHVGEPTATSVVGALRKAGLRVEHVAFNFMKRRI
jgi:hypothetical protein